MRASLQLERADGLPGPEESRVLSGQSLTIGRAVDNGWVLENPDRTVSKYHCRFDLIGDAWHVTDLSTNGVHIDGEQEPLGRGSTRLLEDGQGILLGPYRIRVSLTPETAAEAPARAPLIPDQPLPAFPKPMVSSLLSGVAVGPDTPDPLAGTPENWMAAIPSAGFGPGMRPAPLGWDTPPDPAAHAATGLRPEGQPMPTAPFSSASEQLPADTAAMWVPPGVRSVVPSDWHKAGPDQPPPAVPGQDLARAFLEGVGLDPALLDGIDRAEAMREAGRLVRVAVEGVRDVLATRAMAKAEFRVEATLVRANGNNPLKFSPDTQRCLEAMVGVPPPGFLRGAEAMQRGLDDIKRHELAMLAAINAMAGEVALELDPAAIRGRVDQEGGRGLLARGGGARYWARFEVAYKRMQESYGGTGPLLGAFAQAYARLARRVV